MAYDPDNIFAKILRGEIPCKKIYEDDFALAFHDIAPKAPVHVLVIPKGPYISMTDFAEVAPPELVTGFLRAVAAVVRQLGLDDRGYRLLVNCGTDGGQEVPHLHVHIFAGRRLGRMIATLD
jgi:diadenosine tetraphosphate (Ap4A) HIT family hydrolase